MKNFIKSPVLRVPQFEFRLEPLLWINYFLLGLRFSQRRLSFSMWRRKIWYNFMFLEKRIIFTFRVLNLCFFLLVPSLAYSSTLKMEAIRSFESSVIYWIIHDQNMVSISVFLRDTIIEVYFLDLRFSKQLLVEGYKVWELYWFHLHAMLTVLRWKWESASYLF
jgi:hypothetical protein